MAGSKNKYILILEVEAARLDNIALLLGEIKKSIDKGHLDAKATHRQLGKYEYFVEIM